MGVMEAVTTDSFKQIVGGLSDPDPRHRAACLQELGNMGESGASAAGTAESAAELFGDGDPLVQSMAILAVGKMGQFGAAYSDRILSKLDSDSTQVRDAALHALATLGERVSRHADTVEKCLQDKDPEIVADACFALGSMKVQSCAKKIAAKLQDADDSVVVAAIMGLARLDAEVDAVGKMLSHKSERVRGSVMNSLPKMSGCEALAPAVAKCVADPDCFVRIEAMCLMTHMGEKAAGQAKVLLPMLRHQNPGVRAMSAMSLAGLKGGADEEILAEVIVVESLLADEEEDTSSMSLVKAGIQPKLESMCRKPSCAAAALLGALGVKAQASCPKVAAGLSSPDGEMRSECAAALGKMGGDQFESELIDLMDDPLPRVVAAACAGLGALADLSESSASAAAAEKMAECLDDKSPVVRAAAAAALGRMHEEALEHLNALARKMEDPVWSVRVACIEAIAGPSCGERGQMYAANVCRHVFDQDFQVRVAAVQALMRMGERGGAFAEEVASLLQDPFPEMREEALKALAAFGPVVAGPWKQEIERVSQQDSLDRVKAEALKTLDAFSALAGIADAE